MKKRTKESAKDSSEKVTPEKPERTKNEEDLSKEETSEIPGMEKIKTREFKLSTFLKPILLLLLIGVLSWTIYSLHNTIQNNLAVNNKLKETAEEIFLIQAEQDKIKEAIKSFEDNSIDRIQVEQDKIKGTIKSFQNNRDDLEKLLLTVNKLKKELSDIQNEVKVLQVETNKSPDSLPPQQVQVDVPSQNNQPEKLEIKKEAETKIEESEMKEEQQVKEESSEDVRKKIINLIEDTARTIFQKTVDAFKWIKEKIF